MGKLVLIAVLWVRIWMKLWMSMVSGKSWPGRMLLDLLEVLVSPVVWIGNAMI